MTPEEAAEKVIACCSLGDYAAYVPVIEPIIQQCVDDTTAELRRQVAHAEEVNRNCAPEEVLLVCKDGVEHSLGRLKRRYAIGQSVWLGGREHIVDRDVLVERVFIREAVEAAKESKDEHTNLD